MAKATRRKNARGRAEPLRLEELQMDPIAYLGTTRHPVSMPPTSRDITPVSVPSVAAAHAATRGQIVRRVLAAAVGLAVVLPIAVSLSGTDVMPDEAPPSAATHPVARRPSMTATTDQGRGEERSAADWKEPARPAIAGDPGANPAEHAELDARDRSGVPEAPTPAPASMLAPANLSSSPESSPPEPAAVQSNATEPSPAAPAPVAPPSGQARVASASAPVAPATTAQPNHVKSSVGAFATPFDFEAAMSAVAAQHIGPVQCGLDAVGAVPVSITFAPSGHATRAVVENGALRGTDAGSCVARALRAVTIPPFSGDAATVRTSVLLR